jgi:TolB protein
MCVRRHMVVLPIADTRRHVRTRTLYVLFACLASLLTACVAPSSQAPATDATPAVVIAPLTPFAVDDTFAYHPVWSPDGEWIAYMGNRGDADGNGVFKRRPDGSDAVNVTQSGREGRQFARLPAWSPDGRRLAFLANDDHLSVSIYTVSADGGPWKRVTDRADSIKSWMALDWSPDGQWIAYVDRGERRIRLVPAAGGASRSLLQELTPVGMPRWTPDGTALLYTSHRSGNRDVLLVPASGGTPRPIVTHPGADDRARMSPDGRWISFTSDRTGQVEAYLVPTTGGAPIRITDRAGYQHGNASWAPDGKRLVLDSSPVAPGLSLLPANGDAPRPLGIHAVRWGSEGGAWSPDGRQIAYFDDTPEGVDVFVSGLDDGTRRRLTHLGQVVSYQRSLDWSPDGRSIAYPSMRSGVREIWTVPTDGGEPSQVTTFDGQLEGEPRYSPDGRWLAVSAAPEGDNLDIWILPAAGGLGRRLTEWATWESFPVWSPDGEWIAFRSERSPDGGVSESHLWVIPARGGAARHVLARAIETDWSPDGQHFSVFMWRQGPQAITGIYRVPVEGGTPELMHEQSQGTQARWSPDGESLLYYQPTTGDPSMWIADVSAIVSDR